MSFTVCIYIIKRFKEGSIFVSLEVFKVTRNNEFETMHFSVGGEMSKKFGQMVFSAYLDYCTHVCNETGP